MTFEEYLREQCEKGHVNFRLRAGRCEDGRMGFYVRPLGAEGPMADFVVEGELVTEDEHAMEVPPS